MKYFDWNSKKNQELQSDRGVSFEHVLSAMDDGRLLADLSHPDIKKYKHQRMFIVEINFYAYLVPYVEDAEKIFLKTIIPSRKATKKYLRKE